MTRMLVLQLAIAALMVPLTIGMHLAGLSTLIVLLRKVAAARGRVAQTSMVLAAVLGLFLLHTLEIWTYGALYLVGGAAPNLEDALLYATASYVTANEPGLVVGHLWRLVGAIEGANGIVLFGWSTAFFVAVVGRLHLIEDEWLRLRERD